MTEVSIRPSTGRHGKTENGAPRRVRQEKSKRRREERGGRERKARSQTVCAPAYIRVTYPNVCSPHRVQ